MHSSKVNVFNIHMRFCKFYKFPIVHIGVANFNNQNGCLKCTTVGKFCSFSRTNIFPQMECEPRTDAAFRQRAYVLHQRTETPFLRLPIDMIKQFPVGDSLHLLHHGIMKRLLLGWRDGTFRKPKKTKYDGANDDRRRVVSVARFSSDTTIAISEYLNECKMPTEFTRAVRGLECLAHWKATEYRTFLHYTGMVALKGHLEPEAYEHFLLLVCSVTICSSKRFIEQLPVARSMINLFIDIYFEFYGQPYVTSNVHNLLHLVDEVEQYGELETFSSYPFENLLGMMKRMIRSGNRPLAQIARRMKEVSRMAENDAEIQLTSTSAPKVVLGRQHSTYNIPENFRSLINDSIGADEPITFYSEIQMNNEYTLSVMKPGNSWFLTNEKNVARILKVIQTNKTKSVKVLCSEYSRKEIFFIIPFESKFLDIYSIPNNTPTRMRLIDINNVQCKLVCLKYKNDTHVFIPLLHTNHFE